MMHNRDVHVMNKQLPVEVGLVQPFQIALWVVGPVLVLLFVLLWVSTMTNPLLVGVVGCLVGILKVLSLSLRISARNYFQKIRTAYSSLRRNIDNCLERQCESLQNADLDW